MVWIIPIKSLALRNDVLIDVTHHVGMVYGLGVGVAEVVEIAG